jgi:hypothetical protein
MPSNQAIGRSKSGPKDILDLCKLGEMLLSLFDISAVVLTFAGSGSPKIFWPCSVRAYA